MVSSLSEEQRALEEALGVAFGQLNNRGDNEGREQSY